MPSDATQTPPGDLSAAEQAAVSAAIARLRNEAGALLPILHAIQEAIGYVPPAAVEPIALALNLSRAEVHGVRTFYHDFRSAPPGAHVLKICRAEACQAVGCRDLEVHAARALGLSGAGVGGSQDAVHGTTADRGVTVEPVYCLGNCALGPSIQLDGKLYGKVTAGRLDGLLAKCGVKPSRGGAS
ncbi:MAG: hypothetical protein RL398_2559 [Planctomycetota bacterium]